MDHDGAAGGAGQLGWLLDDLARRVRQVSKAVILSQDGMALGASRLLDRSGSTRARARSAAGVKGHAVKR